jgi:hypothetical protein
VTRGSNTVRVSKKSRRKAAASAGAAGHPRTNRTNRGQRARGRVESRPSLTRRGTLSLVGLAAILVIAGVVFAINQMPRNSPTLLAGTDGQAQGQPVDGISCNTSEQVVYHIHAHLAVYTNGMARIIPEGIGIVPPTQVVQTSAGPFVTAGKCFYWLHSHTQDGIIHVESPSQRVYTLGNYFDIWNQPLSTAQVGPAHGQVTAFVDGRPFTGDPRSIPLNAHTLIQLDVGSASPAPQPFTFPPGL